MDFVDIKAKVSRLEEIIAEAKDIIDSINEYKEYFIYNGCCNILVDWIRLDSPSQNYHFHNICVELGIKNIGDLIKIPFEDFCVKARRIGKLRPSGIAALRATLKEMGIEWK